jgi:hypothetical protein
MKRWTAEANHACVDFSITVRCLHWADLIPSSIIVRRADLHSSALRYNMAQGRPFGVWPNVKTMRNGIGAAFDEGYYAQFADNLLTRA